MKIKIWQSKKNKQFYVSVVATNGRKVFTSEGYKRRASAVKAQNVLHRWAGKPELPLSK